MHPTFHNAFAHAQRDVLIERAEAVRLARAVRGEHRRWPWFSRSRRAPGAVLPATTVPRPLRHP
jgi:hypothetical protein